MTEFANPTDIFPAVTGLTCPMPVLIKDLFTIDKVFDSMDVSDDIEMILETANTSEVIQKNREAIIETYNLSGLLKEEMRIFTLQRRKLQENLTKPNGLV